MQRKEQCSDTQVQVESGEDRRRKCPWLSRSCSLMQMIGLTGPPTDHMAGLMNIIQSCCWPPCDHRSESVVNGPTYTALTAGWMDQIHRGRSMVKYSEKTPVRQPSVAKRSDLSANSTNLFSYSTSPLFPKGPTGNLAAATSPTLSPPKERGKRKYQGLPILLLPVFRSSSLAPG